MLKRLQSLRSPILWISLTCNVFLVIFTHAVITGKFIVTEPDFVTALSDSKRPL